MFQHHGSSIKPFKLNVLSTQGLNHDFKCHGEFFISHLTHCIRIWERGGAVAAAAAAAPAAAAGPAAARAAGAGGARADSATEEARMTRTWRPRDGWQCGTVAAVPLSARGLLARGGPGLGLRVSADLGPCAARRTRRRCSTPGPSYRDGIRWVLLSPGPAAAADGVSRDPPGGPGRRRPPSASVRVSTPAVTFSLVGASGRP